MLTLEACGVPENYFQVFNPIFTRTRLSKKFTEAVKNTTGVRNITVLASFLKEYCFENTNFVFNEEKFLKCQLLSFHVFYTEHTQEIPLNLFFSTLIRYL